jgi:phospholipase D
MSSPPIVEALIDAYKREVKVNILLDKSNLKDSWSKMQELVDSGIEVNIDKLPGIAHNKVIIIDLQRVITGSFNFTRSADTRNAENVIVIDDKVIADRYVQNWLLRSSRIDN